MTKNMADKNWDSEERPEPVQRTEFTETYCPGCSRGKPIDTPRVKYVAKDCGQSHPPRPRKLELPF